MAVRQARNDGGQLQGIGCKLMRVALHRLSDHSIVDRIKQGQVDAEPIRSGRSEQRDN
ncbi:MAG: hypothetical protein H8D52_02820 [Gammaproteobacteria bacterium]|nr:hypothetical protein [Gammaproteobacteria bacterium]